MQPNRPRGRPPGKKAPAAPPPGGKQVRRRRQDQAGGLDEQQPPQQPYAPAPRVFNKFPPRPQQQQQQQQNNNEDDEDEDDGQYGFHDVSDEDEPQLQQQQQNNNQQQQNNDDERSRSRSPSLTNWTFTLWQHQEPLQGPDRELPPHVDFIVYQQEQAPNFDANNEFRGRHWQGYIELDGRYTERQVRGFMGWGWEVGVHFQGRKGTQQQAINYCTKQHTAIPDTQVMLGQRHPADPPGAWNAAQAAILGGADYVDMVENHTRIAVQCHAGIQKAIAALEKVPVWRDVEVIVYYGLGGTGKTSTVLREEGVDNVYTKLHQKGGTQWFDGYKKHKVLLIDEFKSQYDLTDMNRWLDGHPLRFEVKGASGAAFWTKVYICSNKDPNDWYPNAPEDELLPFWRRIKPHNVFRMMAGGRKVPWKVKHHDTIAKQRQEEEAALAAMEPVASASPSAVRPSVSQVRREVIVVEDDDSNGTESHLASSAASTTNNNSVTRSKSNVVPTPWLRV